MKSLRFQSAEVNSPTMTQNFEFSLCNSCKCMQIALYLSIFSLMWKISTFLRSQNISEH